MIKKEELLLHAIGNLPEEIVVQEDIDALKIGARQLKQEERKNKLIYISRCMAAAAACITALIISVNVFYKPDSNKLDESILYSKIHSDTDSHTDHNKASVEKKSANVFVMDIKEEAKGENNKETVEDSLSSNKKKVADDSQKKSYNIKKISYGKTVDLQLIEQKYIVFTLDTDFYFTTANKKNKTYKAKNQVYFDVSSNKTAIDVIIPEWQEQEISIIAYAETETKKAKQGTFYIGKSKDSKKGDRYYGIFIKGD